mmetsp:Transcript_93739/g.195483  ORF Transcript_93739/g.195483 Transcript_93739/m.195483 type:complete len:92 (-) Transcript_93739:313-588(-)
MYDLSTYHLSRVGDSFCSLQTRMSAYLIFADPPSFFVWACGTKSPLVWLFRLPQIVSVISNFTRLWACWRRQVQGNSAHARSAVIASLYPT